MKNFKFELILGAVFAVIFFIVVATFSDFGGKMTKEEVDQYITEIEENLDWPEPGKSYMLESVRKWGYEDTGKSFQMLNMMRYRPELYRYEGDIEDNNMTPKESNYHYELGSKDILLPLGGFPSVWGEVILDRNIFRANEDANNENWSRLGFARYPSRRGFMELMTDPDYGPQSAYKQMGAEVYMIPIEPAWIIPDPRVRTGLVLCGVFCVFGWIRALMLRSRL